jgi:hypothetical protein
MRHRWLAGQRLLARPEGSIDDTADDIFDVSTPQRYSISTTEYGMEVSTTLRRRASRSRRAGVNSEAGERPALSRNCIPGSFVRGA